ncbi:HEAT repeat domain-containing protein [Streptomyces sp. NPDC005805]|uniref:HEAT repeat domain-containing protein n=1 Tax=Streptomyces sp. NPDC005805 TaxID=3157068 RepID=UPI00340234A8
MDLAHALDGLDARPWADFSHAYGGAEDLPELLRAFAGEDEEAASEAESELYGSILHQGTVYPASAEAAPFLARVAAAGRRPAEALLLLGGLAGSEDEWGVPAGTVRAAVAAQLPLLIPLLAHQEPRVRQAAAWAVGQMRAAGSAGTALRERWAVETEPLVRAELLTALGRSDVREAARLARAELGPDRPAPLRLAAVFTALDAGESWERAHHETVLALLPADALGRERFDLDRAEPLHALVLALLERRTAQDTEAAGDLLLAALACGRPKAVEEALWAAEDAVTESRGLSDRLLPALIPLLAPGAEPRRAASLVARFGPAAAGAAPALKALAEAAHEDDLGDRALVALVQVAPEEAAPLLARGLGRLPWALDAAAGFRAAGDFPFHAGLLDAVRERLRAGGLSGNEPFQLLGLLRQWGARAVPALPGVCGYLGSHPLPAARALAAVAPAAPAEERARAAAALRAHAADGPSVVARALHTLTGDAEPLLAALARELTEGKNEVASAAMAAGELGAGAAGLVPALRAALSGAGEDAIVPVLDADVAIAAALWRITGDAQAAVPVLDAVLERATGQEWYRWTAIRAAEAAALLGPAGRPLEPRLRALLGHPQQVPAAVLALLAVEDGDRPGLAATVLDAAERGAPPLAVLDALLALGPDGVPAEQAARLAVLAEGDARVINSGVDTEIVRADERFRIRAREVLAALRARPVS